MKITNIVTTIAGSIHVEFLDCNKLTKLAVVGAGGMTTKQELVRAIRKACSSKVETDDILMDLAINFPDYLP
jgi:hypothetical protein